MPSASCSGSVGSWFIGSTTQLTNFAARLLPSLGGHAATINTEKMASIHHCELFGCHIDAKRTPRRAANINPPGFR